MNPIRRFLAILAAACSLPAAATTASTDYTDLWYLPSESGWGINVVQQDDVVFATLFIYGSDGTPRWFVAPDTRSVSAPQGQNQFTGNLYSTTGTYFGSPWAGTANVQVGNITISFNSPTTGTVNFTANGVPFNRSIVRQTWGAHDLTGNYVGGLSANGTNCGNGVSNGPILIHGELTIGHSNFFNPLMEVVFFNALGQRGVCTFAGGYAQEGKLGRIGNGTFSCTIQGVSNAPAGAFNLSNIQASVNGFTARFNGTDQNCTYDGYFGGIRDVL